MQCFSTFPLQFNHAVVLQHMCTFTISSRHQNISVKVLSLAFLKQLASQKRGNFNLPIVSVWHVKSKIDLSLQLNNLEKAVAAAHTFLKKNPNDKSLSKNMNYYKTLFDVEEYLIDHEEQPYEVGTFTLPNK